MLFPSLLLAALVAATGVDPVSASAQQSPLSPGADMPEETAPASSELATAEDKMAQKDLAGARTILDVWLRTHPADARALFDLGYLEDLSDHEGPATAAYKQAITADPKQMEARLALGLLLARQGHPEEARPYIEAATLLAPATPAPDVKARAWRALAQLDRTTDPSRAKSALLEALKISPESTDDTLLTAEIAEASDDLDTAASAYRRVLAAQPQSSAATAGLVHLLLKQKKYTEAEPLLRSALQHDPDDPALNGQWAAILLAEDKPKEAVVTLEKLHLAHPADAVVGRMLAQTLSQTGEHARADAVYLQLLTQSPGSAELLAGHAKSLVYLEKYPEAMAAYQQALGINPEDGEAWFGLAIAASDAKQYQAALQALLMRSKHVSETPMTFFLRATAYDNLHQRKQAVSFYQKFLAASQGNFPDQQWQAKHRLVALGYTP